MSKLLPSKLEEISSLIRTIRGQKVILDSDLARIFGVQTFRFNEAVKRNLERFPADFMFQLTRQEYANLISQIAISSSHGGRRKLPYAFTENGAIMAANVLNSPEAVRMSVFVVRALPSVAVPASRQHWADGCNRVAVGLNVQPLWHIPQGRRRAIFVETQRQEFQAPSGVTSSL